MTIASEKIDKYSRRLLEALPDINRTIVSGFERDDLGVCVRDDTRYEIKNVGLHHKHYMGKRYKGLWNEKKGKRIPWRSLGKEYGYCDPYGPFFNGHIERKLGHYWDGISKTYESDSGEQVGVFWLCGPSDAFPDDERHREVKRTVIFAGPGAVEQTRKLTETYLALNKPRKMLKTTSTEVLKY